MKVSWPKKKDLAKRGLLISKCHTHTITLWYTPIPHKSPAPLAPPTLVSEILRVVSSFLVLPSDSFARLATCDAFLR